MSKEPIPPEPSKMNRREFFKQAALTGTALTAAVAGGLFLYEPKHFVPGFGEKKGVSLPSFRIDQAKVLPDLAVAHGTSREAVIRAAIDTLGGIERFVQKGDIVMIKPNVAFDRPPALCATTHPEALSAVAKLCIEAGAKRVIVADNPINSPTSCFLKSGLEAVANDLGLTMQYPESTAFTDLSMNGEILRHWPLFNKPFLQATKVIGVSPAKDHNLCHASLSMKNWYGMLGGRRNQFHQHIHSIISDFAMMIQPTLLVLDGMNVLMKNGPTGGRLSDVAEVNTVVAGTDMVAIDSYAYTNVLGRTNWDELGYIHKAHERGLGNKNWKELKLKEVRV